MLRSNTAIKKHEYSSGTVGMLYFLLLKSRLNIILKKFKNIIECDSYTEMFTWISGHLVHNAVCTLMQLFGF